MARPNTFSCPVCGKDVPAKAKACPHCGACDKSGWNEEMSIYDGIDLPDGDFDREISPEEGIRHPYRLRGKRLIWWITGVVLTLVILYLIFANILFRG